MDTKSKLLVAAFVALVAAAVIWKYDTFVVRQDFIVHDQVECDPSIESCFAYECDETDEECDTEPFKKISKSARNIPLCPNYESDCLALACMPGEEDCEVTLCSEEALEDGEVCVEYEEEETPELPEEESLTEE